MPNKILSTLAFLCFTTLCYAQLVTNASQLNSAINSAGPGTTITLANGTWNNTFIDITDNGTLANPITITAQTPGSVFMTGNSRVYMEGSHITVTGLVFMNAANLSGSGSSIDPVFNIKECDYCRVINNKIDGYNGTNSQKSDTFKWILTDGQHNEIAYNSFVGKFGIGSIINDNRNSSEPDYLEIHHNYFADRTPINGVNDDNDQDAIRIGNSATSLQDSYSSVHHNYFHNFFGEVEMISNKSGKNTYYNNTFRDYAGTLTLRHGDDCEVYNNYFFAENNTFSGGIRVMGESHKVYNNYIEGVNSTKADGSVSNAVGGINVTNGRQNTAINGYYTVKNASVFNNTFVNCDYALRIGTKVKSDLSLEPENLIVANNIMYNTSTNPYQIVTAPSGNSVSTANITNVPSSAMADDGNFHRLVAGGAPINAGNATYTCAPFDILEGVRANLDAGAEEFGANGSVLPYTVADVGSIIGFGASATPTLSTSPSALSFDVCGGTSTFEINTGLGWTITENIPWLTLDATAGNGTTTITATSVQNATGSARSGTITITENAGGSNLSTTVAVTQSNTSVSSNVAILNATSVGMQVSAAIATANAYNDDLTNYWTGNPDTEPEVSITFNLGSPHVLTDIGINFWKADERTTTFSIAVSNSPSGPWTTVINSATSAASGVTVNTEQSFNLGGATGQYVQFIGIGNSSATNWTSIANVNIYGYVNCLPTSTLTVSPSAISPTDCGGSSTFQISSDVSWTVSESLSWLTLNTTAGSNNGTITATATQNNTGASRSGTITISEVGGSGLSTTVTVTQAYCVPPPALTAAPSPLSLTACGGSGVFTISSNVNWTITENLSWLTLNATTGSNNGTITATATQNITGNTRSGTITISGGVLSTTVVISQAHCNILTAAPSSISAGVCGGNSTFTINSNTNWTITENLPWLSLNTVAGTGAAIITATTIENTTGAARSGTITISGGGLSTNVTIVQSNTHVNTEVPIVSTTTIGMQLNNPNIAEVNAYNDDVTNYWTGNPDIEPEVSITFNLGSAQFLTQIGLNFWNANARTTTFSIGVSMNPNGPFTIVLNNATSSISTVNTEQIFSLNGSIGRYVKFIGHGNSSATNWTSIANTNIYTDTNCNVGNPANDPCAGIIIENSNPVPWPLYEGLQIHSAGTVINPDVDYEASQFIQLNPGFESVLGTNFHAHIVPCN